MRGVSGFSLPHYLTDEPNGSNDARTWEAEPKKPPHSHPGDDMTNRRRRADVNQRYRRDGDSLVVEGERIILSKGDVGYTSAGRIHDGKYTEDCQLVYVHNGAFRFSSS